jgi:hypothetical protein
MVPNGSFAKLTDTFVLTRLAFLYLNISVYYEYILNKLLFQAFNKNIYRALNYISKEGRVETL